MMNSSVNVDAASPRLRSPRIPVTPSASGKIAINRSRIIILITLTAVVVSVIRLAAYIYYSAQLQNDKTTIEIIPNQPLEEMIYPAYWAAIYYLSAIVSLFAGYSFATDLLQRRLEQQRQQTYLRVAPYSTLSTLCYRYLQPSFSIPLVTASTTVRSVLIVSMIIWLNLICAIYPNSPSQIQISNRAAYLSVANFALLIPLSIRSFPWMAYDTAISWHRVFAMLAFATAAQHGCYHLTERLESLEPIMESQRHVTGIVTLSTVALIILTAHEVVRSNQYSFFRTIHLISFLGLVVSASLHNSSFLVLNFIGIAAWTVNRLVRKIKFRSKLVGIQTTGRIARITLEHSLKGTTAGQFAYLGVTGPGFSKQGWARPFSFSSIRGHNGASSPSEQDQPLEEANTTLLKVHTQAETHHRPGFHHEPSSTQVPDEQNARNQDSSKDYVRGDRNARKVIDMHIHSRGTFTTSLLKAASQQDLESKLPKQIQIELDGPYGTPWLSSAKHYYTDFEMAVFICSGVGITPWLAVTQELAARTPSSRTRIVHLIWSIHDIGRFRQTHCIITRRNDINLALPLRHVRSV